MPDWLTQLFDRIKKIWGRWSTVHKIILFGIVAVIIVAFILLVSVSTRSSGVPILNVVIDDVKTADRIAVALDGENIDYERGSDGRFYARDASSARAARSILIREDLVPVDVDPWELFDQERWTLTDFERNVNLRRAHTANLEQHIAALDDVDSAEVTLVIPETTLFVEDQQPATASVVIMPKPGSDISENRKKIEGIVKLIQFAVEGLKAENITILDNQGTVLNDFEGMEDLDRLQLADRMLKRKHGLEAQYTRTILTSLQTVFTSQRVDIVNIDIDLEFVQKSVETKEHFPVVMTEDDPRTPYSEREVVPSITVSREKSHENFEGTGFNPEGPPGQEGQTPPAYQDLTNLVGHYESRDQIENFEINVRNISEEKSPYKIQKVSASVALDGIWTLKYDEDGNPIVLPDGSRERVYTPVSAELLAKAGSLVEHAVGYSLERGDRVTVENIPFDRSEQFRLEDRAWRREQQLRTTLIYGIGGLILLIIVFIAVRLINRAVERRRRRREEELARQHQAMRERAMRGIEEEGVEVEMSIKERTRVEMQENAKNMAREHPEDVAQLIRTWLIEE